MCFQCIYNDIQTKFQAIDFLHGMANYDTELIRELQSKPFIFEIFTIPEQSRLIKHGQKCLDKSERILILANEQLQYLKKLRALSEQSLDE